MSPKERNEWLKASKINLDDTKFYDFKMKKWIEIREEVRFDTNIIVNREYIRFRYIIEEMKTKDCIVNGNEGSGRGSFIRYLAFKND